MANLTAPLVDEFRNGDYLQVKGGLIHIFLEPFTRWQDAIRMACGNVYGRVRCSRPRPAVEEMPPDNACARCWEAM